MKSRSVRPEQSHTDATLIRATESPVFQRILERHVELSASEREHISHLVAKPEIVPAHRKLIDRGHAYPSAFIVLEGWLVKFRLLSNGHRQILNFRLPGEVGGLDSLAYLKAPHSVSTLTECTIAHLSLQDLVRTQREFPRLATAIFLFSFREEAILHQWEINLGRRRAGTRLAHLILELYHRMMLRELADGGVFRFPPTQQDLADATGLTLSYINRVMKTMRQRGLIETGDKTLKILDMPRMVELGNFGSDYLDDWGLRGV